VRRVLHTTLSGSPRDNTPHMALHWVNVMFIGKRVRAVIGRRVMRQWNFILRRILGRL
jgi:hypothetical protein